MNKITLVTNVIDQGDILGDYLQWYLDLGVDSIVVQEFKSTDNTHEVLERFAGTGRVSWFTLPERNMQKYDMGGAMAQIARDRHGADWIIQCDADEFLCAPNGLRHAVWEADARGLTVVNIPVLNMTGVALAPGQSATQNLTLSITGPTPVQPEHQRADALPVPHIFMKVPPKTMVRADTFVKYGAGTHSAVSSSGGIGEIAGLRFLHFPIRGYDKFDKKIRNTADWLRDNPHLEARWGWHWRRFIRFQEQGRLHEEYEAQFVPHARTEALLRDGTCTVDETVSRWAKRRV